MNNEVRIKPLLKYEVRFYGEQPSETFTADTMVREEDGSIVFHRTGNVIRIYLRDCGASSVIVTPVDDDEQIPE
jgi:hypothetical protein